MTGADASNYREDGIPKRKQYSVQISEEVHSKLLAIATAKETTACGVVDTVLMRVFANSEVLEQMASSFPAPKPKGRQRIAA